VEHPGAADRMRAIYGADRPILDRYVAWVGAFAQLDSRRVVFLSPSRRRSPRGVPGQHRSPRGCRHRAAVYHRGRCGRAGGASPEGVVDSLVTWTAALVYSIPVVLDRPRAGLDRVGHAALAPRRRRCTRSTPPDPGRPDSRLRPAPHPACLRSPFPPAPESSCSSGRKCGSALALPCVRAARARGRLRARIVWRHALGNALVPLTDPLRPGAAGAGWRERRRRSPLRVAGMGRLLYQAVLAAICPLILGGTGVVSVMVVAGSLAADIPRG